MATTFIAAKDRGRTATMMLRLVMAVGFLAPPITAASATDDPTAEPAVFAQTGDVGSRSVTVWARCNHGLPSQLLVRLWTSPLPGAPALVFGRPRVTSKSDFADSFTIDQLSPDTLYYYRAECIDSNDGQVAVSDRGRFRTAPEDHQAAAIRFVWWADLGGQGWGRNPEFVLPTDDGWSISGGFASFEVMRRKQPQFAITLGDAIYADNPIPPVVPLWPEVGGGTWINEPAKPFVATTLEQFRANWRYNLGDAHFRRFLRETPLFAQWDDHEVVNNWWPGQTLTSPPYPAEYAGRSANALATLAWQALFEYNPIASPQLYRSLRHGSHLELFLLDNRSYRGPNPQNDSPSGTEMLGVRQFEWLKAGLKQSDATWKVISTTDPLSVVTGGPGDRDSWGQGSREILGRELQLAQLLKFIKDEQITNVVFISADVHFAAAVSYDPTRAQFTEFNPFREFIVGPLHAGAFGPNDLDPSFGPKYDYLRAPGTERFATVNLPPPTLQTFGQFEIDNSGRLEVQIFDTSGLSMHKAVLIPDD